MKQLRYQAFAIDVDGTLSAGGKAISDEVIASLKGCLAVGVEIIIATGKQHVNIRHLCRRLGLKGEVITCNGAVVAEAESGHVAFARTIGSSLCERLLTCLLRDKRLSIALFTDRDILCNDRHLASRLLAQQGEPTTQFVKALLPLPTSPIVKVLTAVNNGDLAGSVAGEYRVEYEGVLTVSISGERFVEFMPNGVSKGIALSSIARNNNIKRERIACIGDSENDLSMFENAGLRIAVANASRRLIELADVVVPSVYENGVITAVRDHILGGGD